MSAPNVNRHAGSDAAHASRHTDVVKVRLMTDTHRELNGVLHCVRSILVHEGPLAFFKGFGMCWGRVSASRSCASLPQIAVAHPSPAPLAGYAHDRELLGFRAPQRAVRHRPHVGKARVAIPPLWTFYTAGSVCLDLDGPQNTVITCFYLGFDAASDVQNTEYHTQNPPKKT